LLKKIKAAPPSDTFPPPTRQTYEIFSEKDEIIRFLKQMSESGGKVEMRKRTLRECGAKGAALFIKFLFSPNQKAGGEVCASTVGGFFLQE
jgi:hypothetical protein